MAVRLHAAQTRKGSPEEEGPGIPYIAHLMSVAALVLEYGGSETEAIAALLHDGPEDQGGEAVLEAIRETFGPEIEGIVRDCSDTLEARKPKWLPRKLAYLKHLEESASDSAFLVSLADKVHNVGSILTDYREIGGQVWERFSQQRDGTLWYYHALREVYEREAPARCRLILAEYARRLEELDRLVGRSEGITREAWRDFDRRPD